MSSNETEKKENPVEYYFDIDGSYKARKVDAANQKKQKIQSDERVSSISERLQFLLKHYNINQSDIYRACQPLCKMYDIRIGTNDISNYINGKTRPNQDRLTILSKALEVSEVWLLGYDAPTKLPKNINGKETTGKQTNTGVRFDFTLEAKDDSLCGEHIYKDDRIYFRATKTVSNGDLVIVSLNDTQVIRKVYYYRDMNIIIFKNSNPNEDIIYDINDPNFHIFGKAVAFTSNHI